ncbi:hypothetical protein [Halobacteriovorax sp. DA5]|uniref:hypothetical protein n=1 Tax=Halobacteriovorax sp. DA5 TaxID=2067553 RepID=UPI000CD2B9BB|nr:hypothetical protein [Halobacteriovorax sp. DA5]POB12421.1 hypothetical protein C0Z22_15500 [Halobacteriovorax sp. DA5]
MLKKKLILLSLTPFLVIANSFIEVKVHDLNVSKQDDIFGRMGYMEYESAIISRDTLSFNISDRDKNKSSAEVYFKNNQLKLDNGSMTAQFDMSGNTFLNTLDKLKMNNSETAINATYFNINGSSFFMDREGLELEANNFFVFCTTNDPDYDMASGDGIVKGCMTELNITPKSYKEPVNFALKKKLQDGAIFTARGDIGTMQLQAARFLQIASPLLVMDYKQYDVQAKSVDLKCEKDEDLIEIDSDSLMSGCENTAALNVPKILVSNSKEKTKFYFDIDTLNVKNERLNFHSDIFQFIDSKKSVTVKDLNVKCQKLIQSDLLDIPSMIKECLIDGSIDIAKLKTNEDIKTITDPRGRVISRQTVSSRYKNLEIDSYRPLENLSLDKSNLSDISIKITNGVAKVKAHAYKNVLLKKNFDVDLTASVSFNEKESQIIMDVTDVVVPFGFIKVKWIWLIEKIIKNAIVGSNVTFEDGKFYISI